jgi:DNA-binding NarL/FixJ family response regulator
MKKPLRILLVDDHAITRDPLADRLQREPGFSVVGQAGSADEAVGKIKDCAADIVLMDIQMPGLNCFDAVRTIAAIQPRARVIFLSGFVQDHFIDEALSVRASGYLTKDETPEVVIAAIREVASGGAYYSEKVRSRIVIGSSGARLSDQPQSRASTLTHREKEVLRYIGQAFDRQTIADIMHLSGKTVDHHITRIMRKLGMHNRVELARFAIREGIAEA